MAKTAVTTATRSIEEIAEEFALVTDSGTLRLHQSRLTYEFVGSTEGAEAAELRDKFRKEANVALQRHNEPILSDPGVTNLVNTWKYLLRANVDTNPETNPKAGAVAKAAFGLASQTFREKERNYVIPAIEAILNGADAEKVFNDQKKSLLADKKIDTDKKNAERERRQKEADKVITFDSIAATLGMLTAQNIATYTPEQKSTLRDLLANAAKLVK